MELENEAWLPVVGYEGYYEISNCGRLKALLREWVSGDRGSKRKINEHFVSGVVTKKGYLYVGLRNREGVQKTLKMHRLVAEHFIPNHENKPQVNHLDGNKLNNNYWNLEWATNRENVIHSYRNKLQIPTTGGDRPQSRMVLNMQTGVFYDCIQDAANTIGSTLREYMWLYKQLTGYHKNKTPFILV